MRTHLRALLLIPFAIPASTVSVKRFLQTRPSTENVSKQLLKLDRRDVSQKGKASAELAMPIAPIEDQVMGMTELQKQELLTEINSPNTLLSTAIHFVKSHPNEGWAWCANDGQLCTCSGQARYGSYAGGWPTFTNPIAASGSLQCSGPLFQSTLPPSHGYHCQCKDASEAAWQNTKLRYNSKSYLQEAWIALTRVMAAAKLLPMNGDRLWNGEALFSSRGSGSHDRVFMEYFLAEATQYIPTTAATCLEWAPTMYMPRFPACTSGRQLALDFQPDINKMHVDANGVVHCDNVHLGSCLGTTRIDVALNTNVWEHEIEPFAAMKSLYNVMSPGGVMLFTVPFVAPFHGVPYDFYRYTKSGVVHLLESAGFCAPKSRMASGGDFINDIALMAGVGPGDFSPAELQASYFRGYDNIPDGSLVIMAVAHKKANPTDICPP